TLEFPTSINDVGMIKMMNDFDLPALNIDSIIRFKKQVSLISNGWEIVKANNKSIRLSKKLTQINDGEVFNINENWNQDTDYSQDRPGYSFNVAFAYNKYGIPKSIKQINDSVTIVLADYTNRSNVYLSGNFNDWSTSSIPMTRIAEGWQVTIKLMPGKYLYKFIIDGEWISDPANAYKEEDGHGSYNSIYVKSNHLFFTDKYLENKKLVVAGNFNSWNEKQLTLLKNDSSWYLPVYLKDGTYQYKFIVDNEWKLDPGNNDIVNDGQGNFNSQISFGNKHQFYLPLHTNAKRVVLTGDFVNWHTTALQMNKVDSGWIATYALGLGNYAYYFLVDDSIVQDPKNNFTIEINQREAAFLSVGTNYQFRLPNKTGSEIFVTGSFINWKEKGCKMNLLGDHYQIPVYLPKGKTLYKFIIDGQWKNDPTNLQVEDNEYGTGNSVIWIE
ncbi:MAG: hypothetical protein RL065_1772, partial [Bacteroidota bacterium]